MSSIASTYTDAEAVRRTSGIASGIEWEVTEMRNERKAMEDDWVFCPSLPSHPNLFLAAVFDGHGGKDVATFLADNLVDEVDKMGHPTNKLRLTDRLLQLDQSILRSSALDRQGCCAVIAIGNVRTGRLLVANVGDCRAALLGPAGLRYLTSDHKNTDEAERTRISAAGFGIMGPYVLHPITGGGLSMTRAFGDATFKNRPDLDAEEQAIVAVPTFTETLVEPGTTLLLMSDGAPIAFKDDPSLASSAGQLHTRLARTRGLRDNLTVLTLVAEEPPDEPGAKRARVGE